MSQAKGVVGFDFDDTILNGFPEEYLFTSVKAPQRYQYYDGDIPWCLKIRKIMAKVTKKMNRHLATEYFTQMELNQGFLELLQYLKKEGYELVIISGSNDLFVNDYLNAKGLREYFSGVVCNHMEYSEETGFVYEHYPVETTRCGSKDCRPPCKRKLLLEYLNGREVQRIFFVGDGCNDFCPMTLTNNSKAFVRRYYPLSQDLKRNKHLEQQIPGKLVFWDSGFDILDEFRNDP